MGLATCPRVPTSSAKRGSRSVQGSRPPRGVGGGVDLAGTHLDGLPHIAGVQPACQDPAPLGPVARHLQLCVVVGLAAAPPHAVHKEPVNGPALSSCHSRCSRQLCCSPVAWFKLHTSQAAGPGSAVTGCGALCTSPAGHQLGIMQQSHLRGSCTLQLACAVPAAAALR